MKQDPFDAMAERLLARLEIADTARRGFATEKTAEDLRAQVEAVAAFLREDYQSFFQGTPATAGLPIAVARRPDRAAPVTRR